MGLSAAVAGWGCFGVVRDLVNSLCPLSHSSELLHAADTSNDYNYRLEERRDGAVSRVVCSVLFFCVTKTCYVAMPSGYKLVITRARGMYGIYCTEARGRNIN